MATVTDPKPQIWLRCKLDKGMFSDELAVTFPVKGDTQKSVFVAKSDVQGEPGGEGKVLVRLVIRGDKKFAVLPSANRDIVFVQPQDISTS